MKKIRTGRPAQDHLPKLRMLPRGKQTLNRRVRTFPPVRGPNSAIVLYISPIVPCPVALTLL